MNTIVKTLVALYVDGHLTAENAMLQLVASTRTHEDFVKAYTRALPNEEN